MSENAEGLNPQLEGALLVDEVQEWLRRPDSAISIGYATTVAAVVTTTYIDRRRPDLNGQEALLLIGQRAGTNRDAGWNYDEVYLNVWISANEGTLHTFPVGGDYSDADPSVLADLRRMLSTGTLDDELTRQLREGGLAGINGGDKLLYPDQT